MSASKSGCGARRKRLRRRYRADEIEMRFDIIAVDASGKRLEIELLRNAF